MELSRAPDGRLPLAGRRAVVTGGSRGIGRSIAFALARAGASVAVVARNLPPLESVAAELRAEGLRCFAVSGDVNDPDAVERMAADAVAALAGVEILVNNAGTSATHKLLGHPHELWHRMLLENLTSVYYVTRAFLPHLVDRGFGRIINVASVAARTGSRYTAAYTAAKHGVLGLTRVVAAELEGTGITANAICPGFVDTPMTDASIERIVARTGRSAAQAREALGRMNPQGRLLRPEEVAAVAVFLADERSGGITGHAIDVDGTSLSW